MESDSISVSDILFSLVLLTLSGLFSGLTLGLLSLDKIGLEIVIASGDAENASAEEKRNGVYARRILPVRTRGNLLLCTLLLGNVAVNSLLSITLAGLSSGLVGFVASTSLIVVFGEIMPQAVCSRHGLAVGAHTVWIVKFFLVLTFFVSFPLSRALDWMLGREIGTIYNRNQLKRMMELYSRTMDSDIAPEETVLVSGAIDFHQKKAQDVMTPIDKVFMMEIDTRLDFDALCAIFASGHSRIPVYEKERNKIVGMLFAKELILVNPEDCLPIRTLVSDYFGRTIPMVFPDAKLDQLLDLFQTGRSHLALVRDVDNSGPGDPFYINTGIVTLEDVMEELIQEEILDEADRMQDPKDTTRPQSLLIFFQQLHQRSVHLGFEEIQAIRGFIVGKFPEYFAAFPTQTLINLIKECTVVRFDPQTDREAIYQRGDGCDKFGLVLDGKVQLVAGEEEFEATRGPWSSFALKALTSEYILDYSVFVKRPTRMIFISRAKYQEALGIKIPDAASPAALSPRIRPITPNFLVPNIK